MHARTSNLVANTHDTIPCTAVRNANEYDVQNSNPKNHVRTKRASGRSNGDDDDARIHQHPKTDKTATTAVRRKSSTDVADARKGDPGSSKHSTHMMKEHRGEQACARHALYPPPPPPPLQTDKQGYSPVRELRVFAVKKRGTTTGRSAPTQPRSNTTYYYLYSYSYTSHPHPIPPKATHRKNKTLQKQSNQSRKSIHQIM